MQNWISEVIIELWKCNPKIKEERERESECMCERVRAGGHVCRSASKQERERECVRELSVGLSEWVAENEMSALIVCQGEFKKRKNEEHDCLVPA